MKDKLTKKNIRVKGMSCSACAVNVENTLKKQAGVKVAVVNFADNLAYIEYDPEAVSLDFLKNKVKESGYDLFPENTTEEELQKAEEKEFLSLRNKLIVAAIFSAPVFIISMFFMDHGGALHYILMTLCLPVIFYSGSLFYRNAFKQALHFSANMDTLVALSTGFAFIFSVFNTIFPSVLVKNGLEPHVYFESAAVIITFILLGKLLEHRARKKASVSIRQLISLQPKTCIIIQGGLEVIVPVTEIQPGDDVIVKAGGKVPVDGRIKTGHSFIDESMITGEPIPVEKEPGCDVYAGTINQNKMIVVTAEKPGNETLLSQIIGMVKEAQSQKAPIQKTADRIAGIFVPSVLVIATLTFILWMIFGQQPALMNAFVATITVIIIACPCALGLATPTALIAGIGKASVNGILIRNATVLEKANRIDALVLDKTGTLTTGKAIVQDILWTVYNDPGMACSILYTMEAGSGHPLAKTITSKLMNEVVEKVTVTDIEEVPAKGIKCSHEGIVYFAGNDKMLNDFSVTLKESESAYAERFSKEGKTIVYFGQENSLSGIIIIADEIRETSASAVHQLKQQGIQVFMLTGDEPRAAAFMAEQAGIDFFKAGMLPAEKAGFIKDLQLQGLRVAMAGDGINDAVAMAQANLGIALAGGSDIAIENADMILMKSDLQHIVKALEISKLTLRFIRQNLFWAFAYNIITIPVAAGILFPFTGFLLNPMIAGAAMSMSSVSVVANTLRLAGKKNLIN